MSQNPPRWLLLIHRIPAKPDYLRVKIARRLQKIGAQSLKQAVAILPLSEETREDMQWALDEIRQIGGEAFLWEASAVAGLSDGEIEGMFRQASEAAYEELAEEARRLAAEFPPRPDPLTPGPAPGDAALTKLKSAGTRLHRRLEEIRAVDFFQAAGQGKVVDGIKCLVERAAGRTDASAGSSVPSCYTGKTWVTRSGVNVDRIASAWLIRRYLDPKAEFRFLSQQDTRKPGDNEVRFDMFEAEFGHQGGKCTFEVLCERFGITDPGVQEVGEIVHDIDLKERAFARPETAGIEALIRGLVRLSSADSERLDHGFRIFDQLRLALVQKVEPGGKKKD